ncbi:unnamed protein product [Prunus armeniaca]|uniref:C2H2-type domain-containing protein n=1 Tax=Prunus armeniaca TaxID=36596 RepID=A0A6J5TD05_PRUAR|nr:unnamed protein product [Prunus armeniaca]CAB4292338.1 unnamed protein product [Prunus armeniaca]
MSGCNWNMRHGGNVHGSNCAPASMPSGSTEIACRICDRVFMSTQALINHIESHIVDDGLTASRLRQLTQQTNTNPPIRSNPVFPLSNPFNQRNPFHDVHNNQIGFAPPPPHHQYPYPPQQQLSPYALPRNVNVNVNQGVVGSHYMVMQSANETAARMASEEDDLSSDCTMPLLSQLDRPLPPVNYELDRRGNIGEASSDNLDLTLKL